VDGRTNMTERSDNQTSAPEAPADRGEHARGLAILFAAVPPSQPPGLSESGSGQTIARDERGFVLDALTEKGGRIVKIGDDFVVARLADATGALGAAVAIQKSAQVGPGGSAPRNIRIFVHCGEGAATEEGLQRDLSAFVARMADAAKPGHIYVSTETRNAQQLKGLEFRLLEAGEEASPGQLPFYDVVWLPEAHPEPTAATAAASRNSGVADGPFEHGEALTGSGTSAPCFYCGSKKHRTAACPSKHLPYATNGLERLSYLSMGEINSLFSDYLKQSGDDLPAPVDPPSNGDPSLAHLAPWGFYELKRVFQLRFLDVVWNASSKSDWHKARERRGEGFPEGGMLWYAKDCIRTSRLEEAEELLRRYGRMAVGDYRAACGFVFIGIEKESYIKAADVIYEVLEQNIGNLQRTYLLLLLSRIYQFIPNLSRADEKLRDALRVEPYCPEAMFEQIIRHFQAGKEAEGTKRLLKLIHIGYKEYYAAARIAPELVKYREHITPAFQKLTAETKREAEKVTEDADREVGMLKSFVGENDVEVASVLSSHARMRELLDKPSGLLSYHEASALAGRIIATCKELDRERATNALTVIQRAEIRVSETLRRSSRVQQATSMLQPILDRLAHLKEELKTRAPLALCLSRLEDVEKEADAKAANLKEIEARQALLRMWTRLSKDVLLISFITATFGLVILPGTISLVHSLSPASLSLEGTEVWAGQKAILLVGALFAVLFAGFRALAERHGLEKGKSEIVKPTGST
jgi:hypothetical protein